MRGLFRWSSKWWPGVIPLVVLWALAAWNYTAPLEADLAVRSGEALKNITLDKTRIAIAGRDVTLNAESFSVGGRQSAVASIEAVPGVRLVNDETRLVPEAKPFVWSAERDVVRVTLAGSAEPSGTVALADLTAQLGSTTAGGTGVWSFKTGVLADTVHVFTATATAAALVAAR